MEIKSSTALFFQKISEIAGKINHGYKITNKTNSSSNTFAGKELDDDKQLDTGKELDLLHNFGLHFRNVAYMSKTTGHSLKENTIN